MKSFVTLKPHGVREVHKVQDKLLDPARGLMFVPGEGIELEVGLLELDPIGGEASKEHRVIMEVHLESEECLVFRRKEDFGGLNPVRISEGKKHAAQVRINIVGGADLINVFLHVLKDLAALRGGAPEAVELIF
jgi:hypothetical protein